MSEPKTIITGEAAISLAASAALPLYSYANPIDDGGPVSIEAAREIAKEDPSLVYITAPAPPPHRKSPTASAIA